MYEIVITLRTLTDARQAQSLCRRAGIPAAVIRTARDTGCAYGLQVAARDGTSAAILLQRAGIPFGREALP